MTRAAPPPEPRLSGDVAALAALFAVSGCLHLLRPGPFVRIVPHRLPAGRALVHLSGAAELACAAGLLRRSTRGRAGLASAVLLVGVFPANVQMALEVYRDRGPTARALALARLPLQVPLVKIGWRAWRRR
jgi:uncharacterized membrane protein